MGLQCPPLLLKELMRLQTLVDSGNHNFSRWLKGAKNSSKRMYSVVLLLKVWSYAIETCWWTNWFKGAHLFAYTHKNTRSHLRSPNKSYWNVSPVTISAITRFASHDKWSHFVCPCVYSYIFPSLCVCDSTLFGQQDTNKYSHSISEGASPELQQKKNSQRVNSKSLKHVTKLRQ